MIKIHVLSDLHLEMQEYVPPKKVVNEADIVILSGDIHKGHLGLSWARNMFPEQEIIYILGNHEFYNREYYSLIKLMRKRANMLDIHFLENDELILYGIRFLGCTLWTNYKCYDFWTQQEAMQSMMYVMADHKLIKIKDNDEERTFTTRDALQINMDSTAWLTKKLFEQESDLPTVVITHHVPSTKCEHHYHKHNEMSVGFYSDIENLVEKADYWIYGHTHSNLNIEVGKCKLLSNQRGYPNEYMNGFNENLLIEINTNVEPKPRKKYSDRVLVRLEDEEYDLVRGWTDIINQLEQAISYINNDFKITYLREQNGGLVFDAPCIDKEADLLIVDAKSKCYSTCQICSQIATLRQLGNKLYTLCSEHYQQKRERYLITQYSNREISVYELMNELDIGRFIRRQLLLGKYDLPLPEESDEEAIEAAEKIAKIIQEQSDKQNENWQISF